MSASKQAPGSRATDKELYERESKKTFSGQVSQETKARMTPKQIRRQEAIFEIINTERQYVADLLALLHAFVTPLQEKKVLKPEDLFSIFPNLDVICRLNRDFLTDLECRLKTSENRVVTTIGDIFIEKVPTFSLYTPYCANQPVASSKIEELRSKHSGFHEFMKSRPKEFRGLYLDDFLIKPVQRITKYPLLLRAVLENTEEDDPDYQNIATAWGKIKEIVQIINERTRQAEGRQKVLDIQTRLGVPLMTRARLWIRQGSCVFTTAKGRHDCTMYLFNDLVLWSKIRKGLMSALSESKEEELERVPLSSVEVTPDGKSLSLTSTQDEFRATLTFNSEEEQGGWLEAFRSAIVSLPKIGTDEELGGSPSIGTQSPRVSTSSTNVLQMANSSSANPKTSAFSILKRLSSPPMRMDINNGDEETPGTDRGSTLHPPKMSSHSAGPGSPTSSPHVSSPLINSPAAILASFNPTSSARRRPKTFSYTRQEEIGDVNSILRDGTLSPEELEKKIELESRCSKLRKEVLVARLELISKVAALSSTNHTQEIERLESQMRNSFARNEDLRQQRDSLKVQLISSQSPLKLKRGKKSK